MKSTSETMYQRKERLTETRFSFFFFGYGKTEITTNTVIVFIIEHMYYFLLNNIKMEFVGVVTITVSLKPLYWVMV